MEYSIKVTNEGKIAGKATEIVDYMPEDVTFDASLNQSWYKGEDGNLYTTALANEQINPGESKEVKLILTKKMTENNTGTTFNTAEIAGDTNSENIADTTYCKSHYRHLRQGRCRKIQYVHQSGNSIP